MSIAFYILILVWFDLLWYERFCLYVCKIVHNTNYLQNTPLHNKISSFISDFPECQRCFCVERFSVTRRRNFKKLSCNSSWVYRTECKDCFLAFIFVYSFIKLICCRSLKRSQMKLNKHAITNKVILLADEAEMI